MPAHVRNWPLLLAAGLSALGLVIFGTFLRWSALTFTVKVTDLAGLLAPLAFAAAVVERAVEILISPWRDAGANKLEKVVAAIQARPADSTVGTQNASDLKVASDALDEYRGATQQYAFIISLTLSILVSIAGVRALESFIDPTKSSDLRQIHSGQYLFFLCVDVAVSAALLAGGAEGIHSLVNAVTSFFDATADKAKQ